MNRREGNIQPTRIVFCRWSRNPAAVFHSRRAVVNISRIRANVLDQLVRKNSSTRTSQYHMDLDLSYYSLQEDDPDLSSCMDPTLQVVNTGDSTPPQSRQKTLDCGHTE